MGKLKGILHYISFLQFPLHALGIWSFLLPFFKDVDPLTSVANGILCVGIAMNFSALVSYNSSSKLVKKMQGNRRLYLFWVVSLLVSVLFVFVMAAFGLFTASDELRDLWISLLVLGIGMWEFLE